MGVFWTVWVQPTGTHFSLFYILLYVECMCVCVWAWESLQVLADQDLERVLDCLGLELQVALSC